MHQFTHHEEGYGKNAAEQRAFAAAALPVFVEALGNSIHFKSLSAVCKYKIPSIIIVNSWTV